MAASWVKEDKDVGILPVNWLAERKLPKVKTIISFAQNDRTDNIHSGFTG